MKKTISVILAVILAATTIPMMMFAAAVPYDVDGSGAVDTIDARLVLQIAAKLRNASDFPLADVDDSGAVDAIDARMVLQAAAGLRKAPVEDEELAFIVRRFNELSAKKSAGNYSWTRECSFTEDGAIDVGNATGVLNNIISQIDANASLDSVVGSFIGVGNDSGTVVNGKADGSYALKAMSLEAEDVASYKVDGMKYTVRLKDCQNPQKDGKNALNHVTDDFITEQEVKSAIASVTNLITVKKLDVKYTDITLEAVMEGNDVVSCVITYTMDAKMTLTVGSVDIDGTGKAVNKLTYSDFS